MQGDPKVDELMRPVRAAIERHVKDRDAKTEIYNRAYEAVMNSMGVNDAEVARLTAENAQLRARLDVACHIKADDKAA